MNIERLIKAKKEAIRFLEKVSELEKEDILNRKTGYISGTKLIGSVKRSSMDLTRGLADLRRSE